MLLDGRAKAIQDAISQNVDKDSPSSHPPLATASALCGAYYSPAKSPKYTQAPVGSMASPNSQKNILYPD